MSPPTPFTRPSDVEVGAPLVDPEDPRVHHSIRVDEGSAAGVALLGAPFDGGVTAGGGRAGAAGGPAAVRRALRRAGTAYDLDHDLSLDELSIVDAGDVIPVAETGETHDRLEAAVGALLARGVVPVVMGGGHDLTFATVAALARHAGGPLGGVSIDAHLDVRPVRDGRITSGTPFRRALEELPNLAGERFVVLGPHGNRNARAHVEWLRARGGQILTLAAARQLGASAAMETALARAAGRDVQDIHRRGAALFVSLDIDAAAQAFAPGCSAPSADGFAPADLLAMAFLAGRHPQVACFDVMEVNPRFDQDDRTAALAAGAIVQFLFGVARRKRDARG